MINPQVCILAGGTGTRLREMTELIPKPLIPIGGRPLIWHIMKLFEHYDYTKFILALGYKQEVFKTYFTHFDEINNDITVYRTLPGCPQTIYHDVEGGWQITLSNTGINTLKGGRLKRIEKYIEGDEFFCCYGDAVCDINLRDLLQFHRLHGKMVTVTGIHPVPRFGELCREGNDVLSFSEKPNRNTHLINGGFYVFNKSIFNYLTEEEDCDLEKGVLELIASMGEMCVYEHKGYWGCMDSLKDMGELQNQWESGNPKWRTWNV